MSTTRKIKVILFCAFLGGVFVLAYNLIFAPTYQSSFTGAIIAKQISPSNITAASQSSDYALALLEKTVLGNVFASAVTKEINSEWGGNFQVEGMRQEKDKSLAITKNKEAKLLSIRVTGRDPKMVSKKCSIIAKLLENNIFNFTNNPGLELKLIEKPTEASPVGLLIILGYSLLGFLVGGVFGILFVLIFKDKLGGWIEKGRRRIKRKTTKKKKKSKDSLDNSPLKEFEIESYENRLATWPAKQKQEFETELPEKRKEEVSKESARSDYSLTDEEIRERLNRLINGEI